MLVWFVRPKLCIAWSVQDYVCYSVTASPAQTIGLITVTCKNSIISSLDNSSSDSVSSIIIGNQTINLYGVIEASTEREFFILQDETSLDCCPMQCLDEQLKSFPSNFHSARDKYVQNYQIISQIENAWSIFRWLLTVQSRIILGWMEDLVTCSSDQVSTTIFHVFTSFFLFLF